MSSFFRAPNMEYSPPLFHTTSVYQTVSPHMRTKVFFFLDNATRDVTFVFGNLKAIATGKVLAHLF